MISDLLKEKSTQLKLYLTISGTSTLSHVLSWSIVAFIQSLFLACTCYLALYIFHFDFINNVFSWLWILYLFLIGFSTNIFALLITSMLTPTRNSFVISYFVLLLGFVFQVFLTNPNTISLFY
jgi:hypothetical protein